MECTCTTCGRLLLWCFDEVSVRLAWKEEHQTCHCLACNEICGCSTTYSERDLDLWGQSLNISTSSALDIFLLEISRQWVAWEAHVPETMKCLRQSRGPLDRCLISRPNIKFFSGLEDDRDDQEQLLVERWEESRVRDIHQSGWPPPAQQIEVLECHLQAPKRMMVYESYARYPRLEGTLQ